jgi:hypothetical protein
VFTAASIAAIVHLGDAICSINFCHTFPRQDVAHINGTGCVKKKITKTLNQCNKLKDIHDYSIFKNQRMNNLRDNHHWLPSIDLQSQPCSKR